MKNHCFTWPAVNPRTERYLFLAAWVFKFVSKFTLRVLLSISMSYLVEPAGLSKNSFNGYSVEKNETFSVSKKLSIHSPKSRTKINFPKPLQTQDTNMKNNMYETFSPIKSFEQNSSPQWFTPAARLKVNPKEEYQSLHWYTPSQRTSAARVVFEKDKENHMSEDNNFKQDVYETFSPIKNALKNNHSPQWFTPAARLKVSQKECQTPAAMVVEQDKEIHKSQNKYVKQDLYETFMPIKNTLQNNSSLQWFTPAARLKVSQTEGGHDKKINSLKWFTPAQRIKTTEADKQIIDYKDNSMSLKFEKFKLKNYKVLHKPTNCNKKKNQSKLKPVNRKLDMKDIVNKKDFIAETIK